MEILTVDFDEKAKWALIAKDLALVNEPTRTPLPDDVPGPGAAVSPDSFQLVHINPKLRKGVSVNLPILQVRVEFAGTSSKLQFESEPEMALVSTMLPEGAYM